jgi:hypothetical protein
MAGQLEQLIREVSSTLGRTTGILEEISSEQKRLAARQDDLLQRVSTLEADGRWNGDERREVHQRLGSGDHTFALMKTQLGDALRTAGAAHRLAKECLLKLQVRETSRKKKVLWKLLEAFAPVFASFMMWLLYHLCLVAPQIAKAMEKAGGAH